MSRDFISPIYPISARQLHHYVTVIQWRHMNVSSPHKSSIIQKSFPLSWRHHGAADTICSHYNDAIMGAMASQITNLMIVYSAACSGEDQRKHQRSASLAFVQGIHRWPVNSPHKWPVTRKMFSIWWRHHAWSITENMFNLVTSTRACGWFPWQGQLSLK